MTRRGDERGVAIPYEIDDGRAEPMPFEWYVSTPASSIVATAEDMGRLLLVHLAGGRAGERRILSEKLTQAMHEQQATVHAGVPGWSLGLQMDRVNGRDVAEHGGDIGGFSALFVLIPGENAGFFIVNHGEGSDLRFKVKDALLDRLYPAKQPPVVPPARAEDAARLADTRANTCRASPAAAARGRPSRFSRSMRIRTERCRSGASAGFPRQPDLFIRDDGRRHLGFARDAAGRLSAVSAGSWRVADRIP